jgi:hypothetical protein
VRRWGAAASWLTGTDDLPIDPPEAVARASTAETWRLTEVPGARMQEGRRRGAALNEAAGQLWDYQGIRAFAPTSRLYAVFDVSFSGRFPDKGGVPGRATKGPEDGDRPRGLL